MRRFIMAAMLVASSALAQEPLFDAEGYRIAHYRAPVRQPPAGVSKIALAAAARLVPDRDAIFIDVLPVKKVVIVNRTGAGGWRHHMIPSLARTGFPMPGVASPIPPLPGILPRASSD